MRIYKLKVFEVFSFLVPLFIYVFTIYGKIDIAVSVDDVYIFKAQNKLNGFLSYPYLLYLKSLVFLGKGPLSAWNLNMILSSIVSYGSLYFMLKKMKISTLWVIAFCSLFLFSEYAIQLFSKIYLYAFAGICVSIGLILAGKNKLVVIGILGIFLNFLGRPEYLILVFVSIFLLLKKDFLWSLILGFTLLIFTLLNGGIVEKNQLKNEFTMAYCDSYYAWTGKHFDLADEFKVINDIYGKLDLDLDIYTKNPKMMVKHAFFNIKTMLKSTSSIYKSIFYDFSLAIFGKKNKYFLVLLIVLMLINSSFKLNKISYARKTIIIISAILVVGVFVNLSIAPLNQTLILILPFTFLGMAFLIKNIKPRFKNLGSALGGLIFLISIISALYKKQPEAHNLAYYLKVKSISENKIILSNDIFGFQYLKHENTKNVSFDAYKETLEEAVKRTKPDIVLLYPLDKEMPNIRKFLSQKEIFIPTYKIDSSFIKVGRYIFTKETK